MPHDKSREVRFGLVMYGGVSLAIYINGVTHEFSRLVRGNGVYKLIKGLTDSEMIVDIISGTSAGGVNGIFLSYALANRLDFGAVAKLWREAADIELLLHKPGATLNECRSLLDSEFYHRKVQEALDALPPYLSQNDDPADIDEFDLFVTGTNIDGNIYTIIDDQGHLIDVKDHRSVFWLKHRPYRSTFARNDLTHAALAKLARITSAFPAAFAPVHVTDAANPTDAKLKEWGQLYREAYFLDGGVLDNKPFDHTLRAIFTHPTQCPVERILCYVEPDPERFKNQTPREPNFLTVALDGFFSIPTYQTIAGDLALIAEHNSQVSRYWQICRDLRGKLGRSPATGTGIPINILESQQTLYGRSRVATLGMRALRGLATHAGMRVQLGDQERKRIDALMEKLIAMPPQPPPAGQQAHAVLTDAASLNRFDVYFRLRRLRHTVYKLAEEYGKYSGQPPAVWTDLWKHLNRHIQILEVIQYWMEYLMDHLMEDPRNSWLTKEPDQVWGDLRWYMEVFLHIAPGVGPQLPTTPAMLINFHDRLKRKALEVCEKVRGGASFIQDFNGILTVTDQAELALFNGPELDTFRDEYDQFVALDALVYPLKFVSDLKGMVRIQTLRVSPLDAQNGFSRRRLEDKLAGDALEHFGGFFKRSWRSNDILWGRLDALTELVEATVTRERLEELVKNPHLRAKVYGRFPDKNSVSDIFPHSSPTNAQTIFDWIRNVFNPNSHEDLSGLDNIRKLLIEMAHVEVLLEDLPPVITDAVLEQEQLKPGFIDPLAAEVAAKCTTQPTVDQWKSGPQAATPAQSKVAVYFSDYKVGSKDLAARMPPLVLLEMFTRAVFVLRTCILGAVDERYRTAIMHNRLFRFGLEWPLRIAYWMARLGRREPVLLSVFQGIAFAGSLITLILAWIGRRSLLWDSSGGIILSHWLLLVCLPLVVLFMQYKMAKMVWMSFKVQAVILAAVIILGIIAAFCGPDWIRPILAIIRQ
jgi:patatin-related protein